MNVNILELVSFKNRLLKFKLVVNYLGKYRYEIQSCIFLKQDF